MKYALNGGTDAKPIETAIALWEKGKPMCKVEFIESYIKVGDDYQWNDNHGELIRCKDCMWYDTRFVVCHNPRFGDGWANYQPPKVREDFFCNDGERKTDG